MDRIHLLPPLKCCLGEEGKQNEAKPQALLYAFLLRRAYKGAYAISLLAEEILHDTQSYTFLFLLVYLL